MNQIIKLIFRSCTRGQSDVEFAADDELEEQIEKQVVPHKKVFITSASTTGEVNVRVQDLKQNFENQYGEGVNDANNNNNINNDNNKNINTNQVFTIENCGESDSSSEKEINELRNEIAVNEMVNDDVFFQQQTRQMKINSIVNAKANVDDNLDEYAIKITKDSIEKENKEQDKKDSVNIDDDVKKKDNFSSMLKDKVMGVNMIENDIVDDIQQDINDPHGKHTQTQQTKPNVA